MGLRSYLDTVHSGLDTSERSVITLGWYGQLIGQDSEHFTVRTMVVRFLIAGSLLAAGGCASFRSNPNEVRYETIKADPHRDSQAARELNTQAIEALTCGDFDDAMALANQALVSDVNYGPAHNTRLAESTSNNASFISRRGSSNTPAG